LLQNCTKSL